MKKRSTFLLPSLAILVLTACLPLGAPSAQDSGLYPGKLGIQKAKDLSREAREVEARFVKYLEERADEAVALYKAKYGKEINTDNVRELSKDYAPGGPEAEDARTRAARARAAALSCTSGWRGTATKLTHAMPARR